VLNVTQQERDVERERERERERKREKQTICCITRGFLQHNQDQFLFRRAVFHSHLLKSKVEDVADLKSKVSNILARAMR